MGIDATRAIHACGQGRFDETVRLLRPLRSHAARFGGSDARRAVLDLTLIEAARRGGQELLLRERAQRVH